MREAEFHVGRRVAAARRLRGTSQDALAQRLNVTREQVQQYESGLNLLTAGALYEIARVLNVDVSYFYEELNGASGATPCPYSLSEERFKHLKNIVRRIAADHEVTATGHRKKLSRAAAINMAREVCETLGWSYSFGRDALFAHIASTTPAVPIMHVASTTPAVEIAHVASTREAVPANCGEEG